MAKNEIYLNKQVAEAITPLAKNKGLSKSAYVNEVLTNAGVGQSGFKTIALQIPVGYLADDKSGLQEWLERKSEVIIKLFYPQ